MTLTVSFSPAARVAVPVSVGVVSMVSSEATVGVAGGVVSITTGKAVLVLSLPAGSVALTCRFCVPSASVAVGVMLQLPLAATTAVPSTVVPLGAYRVMVSPGVAPVPVMVGVLSLVMLSVVRPLLLATARVAAGADGFWVSMLTASVGLAALMLPARSTYW